MFLLTGSSEKLLNITGIRVLIKVKSDIYSFFVLLPEECCLHFKIITGIDLFSKLYRALLQHGCRLTTNANKRVKESRKQKT